MLKIRVFLLPKPMYTLIFLCLNNDENKLGGLGLLLNTRFIVVLIMTNGFCFPKKKRSYIEDRN
jgi:hypothetical protein